jgi:hypothetical protein
MGVGVKTAHGGAGKNFLHQEERSLEIVGVFEKPRLLPAKFTATQIR